MRSRHVLQSILLSNVCGGPTFVSSSLSLAWCRVVVMAEAVIVISSSEDEDEDIHSVKVFTPTKVKRQSSPDPELE